MKTYRVVAERDPRWWVLRVPELDGIATQVRRLSEAEGMVRDLISLWLQVRPETFDVTIDVKLPAAVKRSIASARRQRDVADRAQEKAAAEVRTAARALLDAGLTLQEA